ncbi:glycosyltransferase [Streptomyces sp. NPDC029674]|uniref:glycosyltransferase n=1 Tax=Streptomyces sp. NPDC029674 TaxID=3365297 RepID=UPI00384E52B1
MTTSTGPVLFSATSPAGQLNSVLAVAAELSRRAVPDLWFASYDDARSRIESASTRSPVNFVSLDPAHPTGIEMGESDVVERVQHSDPMSTDGFMAIVNKHLSAPRIRVSTYRNMLGVIDRLRPRLMVVDILNASSMDAAMTRGIPFVMTVPGLPSYAFRLPLRYPSPVTGLPRRMNFSQHAANVWFKFRLGAALAPALGSPYVKACRSEGIKNPTANRYVYSDAAAMVLAPSVFGLEYEFALPPRAHLIGAFLPSEPDAVRSDDHGLSRWLDDHTSVVYLGFGTIMRLSRAQIAALLAAVRRLAPHHAFLWKLPESQQGLLPAAPLPDNLRVESWLPSQTAVLAHPHVRAFVTHGGANGFHESVFHGKPMLVMPAWLDCHAVARRAVDSGVGLAVDRPDAVTGDEAAAKITRILTEGSFRERAEHWAERLREAGGVGRAADLVLELAAGGPDVPVTPPDAASRTPAPERPA